MTALTYWGLIGLGAMLVAISLLLATGGSDVETDVDVDGDVDVDADADGEEGTVGEGLSILSMAGIGSLLVGFGAVGYITLWLGLPVVAQVLVGLVGAATVFRLTAWIKGFLFRQLESGRSDGESDLVYQPATVTIAVPPGGRGRGQVLVRHGIKTFYVTAAYHGDRELAVGEQVVITGVSDGVFAVEPYSPLA